MNKIREYIKSCTVGKASLVFHTSFSKSYVSPVNTPFPPALHCQDSYTYLKASTEKSDINSFKRKIQFQTELYVWKRIHLFYGGV